MRQNHSREGLWGRRGLHRESECADVPGMTRRSGSPLQRDAVGSAQRRAIESAGPRYLTHLRAFRVSEVDYHGRPTDQSRNVRRGEAGGTGNAQSAGKRSTGCPSVWALADLG